MLCAVLSRTLVSERMDVLLLLYSRGGCDDERLMMSVVDVEQAHHKGNATLH